MAGCLLAALHDTDIYARLTPTRVSKLVDGLKSAMRTADRIADWAAEWHVDKMSKGPTTSVIPEMSRDHFPEDPESIRNIHVPRTEQLLGMEPKDHTLIFLLGELIATDYVDPDNVQPCQIGSEPGIPDREETRRALVQKREAEWIEEFKSAYKIAVHYRVPDAISTTSEEKFLLAVREYIAPTVAIIELVNRILTIARGGTANGMPVLIRIIYAHLRAENERKARGLPLILATPYFAGSNNNNSGSKDNLKCPCGKTKHPWKASDCRQVKAALPSTDPKLQRIRDALQEARWKDLKTAVEKKLKKNSPLPSQLRGLLTAGLLFGARRTLPRNAKQNIHPLQEVIPEGIKTRRKMLPSGDPARRQLLLG
ncbi:hypothetical protein VTJ04DRAFT_6821 [Mycothermus thermophilus]|uniref:uncharacterized protein n=1 Tax=Humicola insolens TaxID=85995 RepID=UPI0037445184